MWKPLWAVVAFYIHLPLRICWIKDFIGGFEMTDTDLYEGSHVGKVRVHGCTMGEVLIHPLHKLNKTAICLSLWNIKCKMLSLFSWWVKDCTLYFPSLSQSLWYTEARSLTEWREEAPGIMKLCAYHHQRWPGEELPGHTCPGHNQSQEFPRHSWNVSYHEYREKGQVLKYQRIKAPAYLHMTFLSFSRLECVKYQ